MYYTTYFLIICLFKNGGIHFIFEQTNYYPSRDTKNATQLKRVTFIKIVTSRLFLITH